MPTRHFVKYTFLKVDPAWRRLDASERAAHKREFLAACEDYASDALDDAGEANLRRLEGDAERLIAERSQDIEALCEEVAG